MTDIDLDGYEDSEDVVRRLWVPQVRRHLRRLRGDVMSDREPFETARAHGLKARNETREARAVRRQTAEEIALTIEAYIPEGGTIDCPCDDCDLIRDLARLARDIGTKETS